MILGHDSGIGKIVYCGDIYAEFMIIPVLSV